MPKRPNYFYMANLWSEIEKIFIWKERGDEKAMNSALNRAMPIIERIKQSGNINASSEVSILVDVLLDLKNQKRKYIVSRAELSSYLKHFASRLSSTSAI